MNWRNPGPVVTGLLAACAVLIVMGLVRAIGEHGAPGFTAYLKLLFGPALGVAAILLLLPGTFRNAMDTRRLLSRAALAVLIVTAGLLAAAGLLGIGWMLPG